MVTWSFETHILQVDGRANPWRWGPEEAEVSEPAFSPDGYLERLGDTRIMSRRVESTTPPRLAAAPRVAFALPFALARVGAYLSLAYAVEPGGRRVLVVRPDEREPNDITSLNVITNWPEEVKAKLRGRR